MHHSSFSALFASVCARPHPNQGTCLSDEKVEADCLELDDIRVLVLQRPITLALRKQRQEWLESSTAQVQVYLGTFKRTPHPVR